MSPEEYESYRRLWKMFFPHLTENIGCALTRKLLEIRDPSRNSRKPVS